MTFPGHPAFTPSNSAIWQRSSKYATSERPEYAPSEHGARDRSAGASGDTPRGLRALVRRFVLGDDVRRDPAALVHLVAVRPGPLADARALLAARAVALPAAAKLRAA